MKRPVDLLLDVWREVCGHLELAESVARVVPLLLRRLPLRLLLIRHLDTKRCLVETVAADARGTGQEPSLLRSECSREEVEQLRDWGLSGQVLRGPAAEVRQQLPGLLPVSLEGEILAAALPGEEEPAGFLILQARPSESFQTPHESLLLSLLEPFAVALENDRRLRELRSLREAVEADNRSLLSRLGRNDILDSIIGAETGLRTVMEQIELVARSEVPVLILGETGSGKEVVARAIHTRSLRAAKPFLRVNCGAIPPELVDSDLFGHERGSFTGAVNVRKGWFERADGGTLFLDECAELPLAVQVRLLRILQDGSFGRVGGERQLTADVRLVAATHRDLPAMVADGRFREDLWYRMAVFPIRLPPLRERRGDIPRLADHFLKRAANRIGVPPLPLSPSDLELLLAYPWPGNVRELAAVMERAAILGAGERLEVAQALGAAPPSEQTPPPLNNHRSPADFPTLDNAMTRHIEAALARTRGRIEGPEGAAALLEINPHTLRARMRKLRINWQRFRPTRQGKLS
jgi:transcriptional regulator with GAF, ATPase, and Fis domain